MPTLQLYDKLLMLPLFQGMSHNDLADVVGHTKFGFLKVEKGRPVVTEDAPCTHLYFLLSGRLQVESRGDTRRYTLIEDLPAPTLLQPEHLFGLTQRFTKTFTAQEDCHFITLDKSEVLRLSEERLIFRLNLLNLLSTQAQKALRKPWQRQPQSVEQRIVNFIAQRCIRPAGEKTLRIKMTDLANEICDSRLNVSIALNAMQAEGLAHLSRSIVQIPRFELLITALSDRLTNVKRLSDTGQTIV